jgi:tRNA pseudouridine32 synthase/23S rRNA pseudouridine746 synthase
MSNKPPDFVLWYDDAILVVNKPPGLLTLPDGYEPGLPYLASILEPRFGRLWIVHRLDKETSGVLVLARSPEAHSRLNNQFALHKILKIYHAICVGNPDWDERAVNLALLTDGDRKHRTVITAHRGKTSVTHLQVLERFCAYVLIEAIPETGRTHQIRAHLAATGFPVSGDALYGSGEGIFLSKVKPGYHPGKAPEKPILGRLGLHACSLRFTHPLTGKEVKFEAPYPPDFETALRRLRKTTSQKG